MLLLPIMVTLLTWGLFQMSNLPLWVCVTNTILASISFIAQIIVGVVKALNKD